MFKPHCFKPAPMTVALALCFSSLANAAIVPTGDVTPVIPTNGIVADALRVGKSGVGTLTITGGSKVTSIEQSSVGGSATGDGTVTISGANSTWTMNLALLTDFDDVALGASGTAKVTISNKGKLETTGGNLKLFIGRSGGSKSTVTVTGLGSTLLSNYGLYVGNGDGATALKKTTASLSVTNQGTVESHGYMRIGHEPFSTGVVTINKSTLKVTGTGGDSSAGLAIGTRGGTGTLTVTNGGNLTSSREVWVGRQNGSKGTLTVTGKGSTLRNTRDGIWIGGGRSDISPVNSYIGYGTGTMNVLLGGVVTGTNGYVGFLGDTAGNTTLTSKGTVDINGVGSRWDNTLNCNVGGTETKAGGTGIVTVRAGGQLRVGTAPTNTKGTLGIYSPTSQVNLQVGGTIVSDRIEPVKGKFNFTGGTLSVTHFNGNLVQNGVSSNLAPVSLTAPGLTDVAGTYALTRGNLRIEFASAASFDQVKVLDAVTLGAGAKLVVAFLNGFKPNIGSNFDILTGKTITGKFLFTPPVVAGLKFELQYLPGIVRLKVLKA